MGRYSRFHALMKFIAGTFIVYIVATGKWKAYRDLAVIPNTSSVAAYANDNPVKTAWDNLVGTKRFMDSKLNPIGAAAGAALDVFNTVSGLFK